MMRFVNWGYSVRHTGIDDLLELYSVILRHLGVVALESGRRDTEILDV